ncbi:hypothetical protein [Paenibacillus gorillae]|uniref:hypothetical protein n=1 Tax=Paenibacillus gorillae TaxID=1243662 RepID=UPI0005AA8133|nr:hypothetical protein [Paenibacillus gorillae]
MEEENYLILVKGKDHTSRITSYNHLDSIIELTYLDCLESKSYPISDVVILNNPFIEEITKKQAVFLRGNPLSNVIRVMNFGPRIRIFFANGNYITCEADHVRIESSGVKDSDALKVMEYWRAISVNIKSGEEQPEMDDFLKK